MAFSAVEIHQPPTSTLIPNLMNSEIIDQLAAPSYLANYPRKDADSERRPQLISLADHPESSGTLMMSGLWLLHGFLDESHSISQESHSPEGSFWHAIMHRLEGDFWNSKYWYRKVGSHAAFETISQSLSQIEGASELFAGDQWDPETFVDLCEQSTHDSSLIDVTHQLARVEWQTLFDYSLPG